ncbi:MAG: ChaN family lipoprotein [Synechococcaceae cyanobacterium]
MRPRRAATLLLAVAPAALALAAPVAAAPGGGALGGGAAGSVEPLPEICAAPLQAARTQQQRLPAIARRQPVILLGEIHTSVADHAWQLQSLQTLAGAGLALQLGLEMVPAARQAALDRYGRGESDEATFLKEVGWAEVWGHDPALYLPLLRWARKQGVPLVALNAEPALVRRVRREGLAAVPPAERQGIGEPAPLGAAYRERLRAAWRAHGGSSGDSGEGAADLERFLDSQRLRDRAMAERLAAARRADPQRLAVACSRAIGSWR